VVINNFGQRWEDLLFLLIGSFEEQFILLLFMDFEYIMKDVIFFIAAMIGLVSPHEFPRNWTQGIRIDHSFLLNQLLDGNQKCLL